MLAPLHVGTSLATSTDPVVIVHLKNVTLISSEGLSGGALQLDGGARAILQGRGGSSEQSLGSTFHLLLLLHASV